MSIPLIADNKSTTPDAKVIVRINGRCFDISQTPPLASRLYLPDFSTKSSKRHMYVHLVNRLPLQLRCHDHEWIRHPVPIRARPVRLERPQPFSHNLFYPLRRQILRTCVFKFKNNLLRRFVESLSRWVMTQRRSCS